MENENSTIYKKDALTILREGYMQLVENNAPEEHLASIKIQINKEKMRLAELDYSI